MAQEYTIEKIKNREVTKIKEAVGSGDHGMNSGKFFGNPIEHIFRKHFIAMFWNILIIGGTFLMLIITDIVIARVGVDVRNIFVLKIFVMINSIFILYGLLYFIVSWIDYYFDMILICTDRLVQIEQTSLFNHSVIELKYTEVQDVSMKISGPIRSAMDYGEVMVETAGDRSNLFFKDVSDPAHVVQEINGRVQKYKRRKRGEVEAFIAKDIAKDMVEK